MKPDTDGGPNRGKAPHVTTGGSPPPRRPGWLKWLLLLIPLVLLLLLLRNCGDRENEVETAATDTANSAATMPATGLAPTNQAPGAPVTGPLDATLAAYLSSGEPAGRRFTFDNLHFATNSAALPADAQQTVSAVAQVLSRHPTSRIQIEGYADARGAEGANARLGAERAEAVARALIAAGVPAQRITAASGSESNPVAPNTDPQGLAANRRTELVVIQK
jgi:outer membrane protein OmpA-like peptidoglycan-associated protein